MRYGDLCSPFWFSGCEIIQDNEPRTAIRTKGAKIPFELKSLALVASSNEEERKRSILMMCFNHFPGAHNENVFPGEWKRTPHQFSIQNYSEDGGSCLTLSINSRLLTCNIRPSCLIQLMFSRSTQRNQNDSCIAMKRRYMSFSFHPTTSFPLEISTYWSCFCCITLKVKWPNIHFLIH